MKRRTVIMVFSAAALVIAAVVSFWASSHPDGLEWAIEKHKVGTTGHDEVQETAEPATAEADADEGHPSPLADYGVAGVSNEFASNALAGIIGSALVLGVVLLVGYAVARRSRAVPPRAAGGSDGDR